VNDSAEMLNELLERVDTKADLSTLLHCLMIAFDGPGGLAKVIREDFDQLPAGSTGRIKIETTIIDLMKAHTPEDDQFDDDTLAAMERHLQSTKGNGDDADLL